VVRIKDKVIGEQQHLKNPSDEIICTVSTFSIIDSLMINALFMTLGVYYLVPSMTIEYPIGNSAYYCYCL